MAYRMKKFEYGYIDEVSGEMLRVGKLRSGSWQIQYRRKFGVLPRNIGSSYSTKASAMRELMQIRSDTPSRLQAMSTEVR